MPAVILLLATLLNSFQDDLDKLLEMLRSDKVAVREDGAEKLAALGETVEPALRRLAESGDADLALRAKEVLARIDNKRDAKAWDERVQRLPETCRDATWKMLDAGKETGTFKIHTSLQKGKLVFDDQFTLDWRGRRVTMNVKQESSADHELRLERITVVADEPKLSYAAEVREGKLVIKHQGPVAELDLPSHLMAGGTLFRAVPVLPKRKGFVYKFMLLDETGRVSEEMTLACRGDEEISHGGKKLRAWKWALEREEVIIGEDANDYYWVTEDRIIRILRYTGREFVLSSVDK